MSHSLSTLIAAVGLALANLVAAHEASEPQATAINEPVAGPMAAVEPKARGARGYFTDLEVLDQHGRRLKFYSDVLAGKVVMINFIYTSCEDACPLNTQAIIDVKERIPELFGNPVYFVSISVDPVNDTPERLRAFAERNHADVEGWTFLTGRPEKVVQILRRLGHFADQREAHSTLLIAGNVPAKRWSKIRPGLPAVAIAERLRALAAAGMQARVGD